MYCSRCRIYADCRLRTLMFPDVADYVIVGGGSSGCAVAHRLSAASSVTVIVLEAGPPDAPNLLFSMPAAAGLLISNRRFEWGDKSEPDPTRHGRTDTWYRGKVLGGSSSLNGMIYLRGHRKDYDDWESAGCRGWSFTEVLP